MLVICNLTLVSRGGYRSNEQRCVYMWLFFTPLTRSLCGSGCSGSTSLQFDWTSLGWHMTPLPDLWDTTMTTEPGKFGEKLSLRTEVSLEGLRGISSCAPMDQDQATSGCFCASLWRFIWRVGRRLNWLTFCRGCIGLSLLDLPQFRKLWAGNWKVLWPFC